MAKIALVLGFASKCGKPLVIVKSKQAAAPSDLIRTDWIEYDAADESRFERKLHQALVEIAAVAAFQDALLGFALEAPSMDCAVALERATKPFLLTKEARYLDSVEQIAARLERAGAGDDIDELERLRSEAMMFVRQGRQALPPPGA